MTFQSIQLGVNNEVVSGDLNSQIYPNNVVPDSQRANIHMSYAGNWVTV